MERKRRVRKPLFRICNGTSCKVNGAGRVEAAILETLNIDSVERDSPFEMKHASCIGSCETAPAVEIGGKLYDELSKDKIKKILEEKMLKIKKAEEDN